MKKIITIFTILLASIAANNSINSKQLNNTDESVTFEDMFSAFNATYGIEQAAEATEDDIKADANASALLAYADKYLGTRYLMGANGPNRFDCSGFTSYVFRHFGYNIARTASRQIFDGKKVAKNEVRPGDLVFFNGRAINSRIGHVGIIYDVKDDGTFTFIHASIKGVRHNNSTDSYYARRYMGACRILGQES